MSKLLLLLLLLPSLVFATPETIDIGDNCKLIKLSHSCVLKCGTGNDSGGAALLAVYNLDCDKINNE